MSFKTFLPVMFLGTVFTSFADTKEAYMLFNNTGKKVSYNEMIEEISGSDYFFFGELHNNPISHWLELEIIKDLYKLKKDIVLGAEFFETDNQLILTEYLSGVIDEKKFEEGVRLWPNYATDYKPLVEFAAVNNINFIATNIPRRYASYVNYRGLEALGELSDEAKKYIPPLPVEFDRDLNCYKRLSEGPMNKMLKGRIKKGGRFNLAEAQAVKDASMAYNAFRNRKNDELFIHFNGSYHSDNYSSIIWYLRRYTEHPVIKTAATVEQEQLDKLDNINLGKADYIIAVDKDITSTY